MIVLTGMITLLCFACKPGRQERIIMAVEGGKSFLHHIQRHDGAICDTTDPLFDVWETVLAAAALNDWRQEGRDTAFDKAMVFLRESEDSAGMVCHNRKCRAAYCLETTAEYFLLLCKAGHAADVKTRIDTVIALQQPVGEWMIGNPDVNEQKEFPSVTAFVLEMIRESGREPQHLYEAFAWLRKAQTPEGHWGSAWEYYECPAYALWPVMRALSHSEAIGDIRAMQAATGYILSTQREDGSWYYISPGRTKLPSPELQTALMLSALMYSADESRLPAMQKGIDYLLGHQRPDGSWDGGFFPVENKRQPKKEYVFATSRAMVVLQEWSKELMKKQ